MNWHRYFIYVDGHLIWKQRDRSDFMTDRSWSATNSNFEGKKAGAIVRASRSNTKYMQFGLNGVAYKNHRVIWEMHHGEIPKGMQIDHVDGDGENNRLENLRLVDQSENSKNRPMQKSNKTGVVGVYWHSAARKWQASISYGGKKYDLGRYDDFGEAVSVRHKAEVDNQFHENHGRIQEGK